jgi:hypothetical protein
MTTLLSRIRLAGCHPYLDHLDRVTFPKGHPADMVSEITKGGNELRDALKLERTGPLSSPVVTSTPESVTLDLGNRRRNPDASTESGLRAGENTEEESL